MSVIKHFFYLYLTSIFLLSTAAAEQVTFYDQDNNLIEEAMPAKPANQKVKAAYMNIVNGKNVKASMAYLITQAKAGNEEAEFIVNTLTTPFEVAQTSMATADNGQLGKGGFKRINSQNPLVNEAAESIDALILALPSVVASHVYSFAKHGTSSILEGDEELAEQDQHFSKVLGRALSAMGEYMFSDLNKNRQASK